MRDELVARTQELRATVQERDERERRAREQLERMRLEPGRYKFARLPVRDLGQGGCGVWEVRPRLGLIGMLAGWWQLKLSSGCPLAMGSRSTRDPDHRGQQRRERVTLALGHRADRLLLRHRYLARNLRQRVWPQRRWLIKQVRDGHALSLPRTFEDHLRHVQRRRSPRVA